MNPSSNFHPQSNRERKKMLLRIIMTILCFVGYGFTMNLYSRMATLTTGRMAGTQFDSSDLSYLMYGATTSIFSIGGFLLSCSLLIALGFIWVPAIKRGIKSLTAVILAIAVGLMVLSQPASAYYDKQDWTENYYILPNETAFWVPDNGDNKSSQAKMDSEQYYRENKVSAKLFNIPHTKLPGSGFWANNYVPAGRLIIVHRTPVARQWVDAVDRGTGNKKEGLKCQSKEGLDITVGISIGVNISPDDAPKYLYNFGIMQPKGNPEDPIVIFTSVLFARPLETVVDNVLKTKIHALACNELAARGFDQANAEANLIMENVKKAAIEYAATVGMTIEFLGWGDTFEFDPKVQNALNEKFRLEKLREVQDVQRQIALNETITKWNGQVPSNVSGLLWLPMNIWDTISGWFHKAPPATAGGKGS